MKSVLVCGGRDFKNRALLFGVLDRLNLYERIHIVHGAAKGADRFAGEWAELRNVPVSEFSAAWRKYGNGAGAIRNQLMLESNNIYVVVAFPGGAGTADMVARAKKAGIRVLEIE